MKRFDDVVDVVFAADVVYDLDLVENMLNVLKTLLKSTNKSEKVAYIATTIRNTETFSEYERKLKLKGFKVELIDTATQKQIFRYPKSNIVIQRITTPNC